MYTPQVASQITGVYNVKLTGSAGELYKNSIAFLSWATIDWDDWIFPGQCIPVGFRVRFDPANGEVTYLWPRLRPETRADRTLGSDILLQVELVAAVLPIEALTALTLTLAAGVSDEATAALDAAHAEALKQA